MKSLSSAVYELEYACVATRYVCFFTLIIPRFLFLLSTCFMFVLFYID